MKLYYDLHLHSCLSPCGDEDATPGNLAGMAALAGLNIVALTDHNTVKNCRVFMKFAEEAGLLPLPGMELTTSEEVHIVCLFPDIGQAEAFGERVYEALPPLRNRPEVFGRQLLTDETDEICGEEERMLLSATSIGAYEVVSFVDEFGGIAFPAHIDRQGFSLLYNLGMWDEAMGFSFAERTRLANLAVLPDIPYIINSDAHRLADLPDAEFALRVQDLTPSAVIDALKKL